MTADTLHKNVAMGAILVIEAEHETRQRYQILLATEGYAVTSVATWDEGREKLRTLSFDLVITDLQPGTGSGAETAHVILALHPGEELFVTVATGQVDEGVAALRGGASGYLQRPVTPDELALRVNRVLYRIAQRGELARLTQENIEFRSTVGAFHKCMAFLRVRDVDRLGDLILDTLMELCAAESGVLWLTGHTPGDVRLRCRRGLAQVAAASEWLSPEAQESAYLQTDEPLLAQDGGACFAALRSGGELVGLIKLESPSERSAFTPADLVIAATVVEFAAAALAALLRVQRSEHELLRAPGGEAYNMAFFRDHLEKELLTAQRYGRHLSLIKLVVDNHDELVTRFHDRQVAESMQLMIAAVCTVLRDADILSQVAPGIYYIMLPETDAWGSLMAQRRIRKAISGQLLISDMKKNLTIQAIMRSASCPGDGPTLAALDRVVEARLATLRNSILLRGHFENTPFWQVADTLLGKDPRMPAALFEEQGGGRYFSLADEQLETFCGAVCRETLETQQGRGVALRGCADFEVAQQAMGLKNGEHSQDVMVYLLGGTSRIDLIQPGMVPIHVEDPVFSDRTFLLCLGDDYSYAFFARRDGERWQAFHTADFYFVENMLAKLLEQYQLQTQI